MKKIILLLAITLSAALSANAQDIITTIRGEQIQAKVLEVSPTHVRYKRYSNLEGPTYTIYTSDLIKIRYENGEEDIFNEALAYQSSYGSPYAPRANDRYRDYKSLYNPRTYIRQWGDPYSPGWSGVASALVPGFGQALCDEWGRGTCFFLGSLALGCASLATADWNYYGLDYSGYHTTADVESNATSGIFGLASLGLYIWSICDAVRVAKVKNMHYQDMRERTAGQIGVKVEPFVSSAPTFRAHGYGTVAGVALRVSF